MHGIRTVSGYVFTEYFKSQLIYLLRELTQDSFKPGIVWIFVISCINLDSTCFAWPSHLKSFWVLSEKINPYVCPLLERTLRLLSDCAVFWLKQVLCVIPWMLPVFYRVPGVEKYLNFALLDLKGYLSHTTVFIAWLKLDHVSTVFMFSSWMWPVEARVPGSQYK